MALKLLEHYLELYRTGNQGSQLRGDEFFDETGSWLEETVMDSGLYGARDSKKQFPLIPGSGVLHYNYIFDK